ncbi:hypothetical protein DL96DRAFT_1712549 [Flagelloscypha sp. PMI_526]|nr:hypothetical protein DL96DRAFT_1712549 [Flagelloscypha sp. PMI_526]
MPTPLNNHDMGSRVLDWSSEKPLDWYLPWWFANTWVKNQTSRSPFFVESDMIEARQRVLQAIEATSQLEFSQMERKCCSNHERPRGELLHQMYDALSAFLDLPVSPIPELPYEILQDIITSAVRISSGRWRWTLISQDVFAWVEPILWEDFSTYGCHVFFPKDISPRFENAGKLVRKLLLWGHKQYQNEDYSRLFSRLPNVRILRFYNFEESSFPLPQPAFPRLERLELRPTLAFGVTGNDEILRPDFSAAFHRNLTHLDLEFHPALMQKLSVGWQSSIETMTHLKFLRIYLEFDRVSPAAFLPFFRNTILPRFPLSLQGCLVSADYPPRLTIETFLALDPRIVWGYDDIEDNDDEEIVDVFLSQNRVVFYDRMCTDTFISCDEWGEEMVKVIAWDKEESIP